MERSNFVFTCAVLREDGGFSVLCLDVDVASDGMTIEDAKRNLLEAVTLYVETAIESNLPIIRPVPANDNPFKTRPNDIAEEFKISVNVRVTANA